MGPTSFASAAAGTSRAESADWSRRANGATQTFRRPSHATTPSASTSQPAPRDPTGAQNAPSTTPSVYVPPHALRNGSAAEGRYSRDQMLHLFRAQRASDDINQGLSDLYVGSWEPNVPNGTSGASWGRKDDHGRDGASGVDLCWDKDGNIVPLSLTDMTDEEREVFTSSVNSPLKPPTQNTNKDGTPKEGSALRKASITGAGAYGLSSPTTSRPVNRRRDTSEAFPFPSNSHSLASPSASRFSRDESSTVTPPPSLIRRRTDFKDGAPAEERDKEKVSSENVNPFGTLKRTTTAPFGASGSGSPWSATPGGGFSPMGAFGSFAHPQADKKPGMGSIRGESRFKGLMNKPSMEDVSKDVQENQSLGNLGAVSEAEPAHAPSWAEARSNRPTSNDTDPYPDDELRTGSAALGGGQDLSPPRPQGLSSFTTPHRQDPRDETGFSAFGMTADNPGIRDLFHGAHQTPQYRAGGLPEPMSPTDTNPYQSPDHSALHRDNRDADEPDNQGTQFPGMGSFQLDPTAGSGLHNHPFGGLGSLGRTPGAFEHAAGDRSQTSSVGPSRGFPNIPGLGGGIPGLGGSSAWTAGQQSIGTPVRERGGLDNLFGTVGEAQSPSLAGLGSSSLLGGGHGGTIGKSSRLGSLFPAALQEQMRSEQHRSAADEGSSQGDRQQSLTGTFGRGAFGSQVPGPSRDTDSPFRPGRNLFDDFSGGHADEGLNQPANLTTSLSMAALNQTRTAQPSAQTPGVNSPAASQPPPPQQRTMVMPDRMRWIYRDPSGNIQGPFSGLEMHDWYKAGFFSPELLVKKQEDADYEPLLQLIRKIGNSREPFLVPQIGIPHGPAATVPGNAWPGSATAGPAGGTQPPFANAFPSFGTTLTAEQQNALERRKQEEQYLMARQKEHLAQQQAMAKQTMGMAPHGILPHQLQHHSSAHSLHSQPSFGSITSPSGYQPSPTQAPLTGGPAVPGLMDNAFRAAPVPGLGSVGPNLDMLGHIREEDLSGMTDRLNLGRSGQQPFASAQPTFGQQPSDSNASTQQVVAMLNDRARLQREQADHDALHRLGQNDQQAAQASMERLQQFQELRLQTDLDQSGPSVSRTESVIGKPPASTAEISQREVEPTSASEPGTGEAVDAPKAEPLSLTEQVQKAASAKQTAQVQSAWNKVEPAIHPFPPPPSQSPLPAPAAQRKPIAADSLAADTRSRSQTPSADTPSASIAPWAKEPAEAPKGPSLKEIQEIEAKKAAEREAVAAAARREAFEQELLAQTQASTAQPGLPSSSTWASGASPITPGAGNSSVWAKPLAGKTPSQPGANAKKTLQQIQKEEEARKQRAAAQAASSATSTFGNAPQPISSGKRYADLASKNALPQPAVAGGAWTTVGASGKTKGPAPAPAPPASIRSASSGIIPPVVKKAPVTRTASTVGGPAVGQANAQEEFKKWAINELRSDLNRSINADDFVASLLTFPAEMDLITESVHSATHNIDSRHFAEEFLRRRKLADKGIIDERNTSSPAENKSGGGWSEVAKKSGQVAQQQQSSLDNGNFKVVAAKKKSGKR
ncbi:hypothetical protein DM02DRAFT_614780 [Periconia macrospinosa]|uniref:GYF domain-containing protein n=1 Tax=Periconia macrospinosa TaxID=97972 RepID=A0A2V1DR95_9PLEO|nr:hypothetical protein DM02DRAFT_614780 [Periconia macrospinosa]